MRPTGRRNPAKINSYFVVKIAFEILPSLPYCWTADIYWIQINLIRNHCRNFLIAKAEKNKIKTILNAKVLVYISYLYIYCYIYDQHYSSHTNQVFDSHATISIFHVWIFAPSIVLRVLARTAVHNGVKVFIKLQWKTVFKNRKPKCEFKRIRPQCGGWYPKNLRYYSDVKAWNDAIEKNHAQYLTSLSISSFNSINYV